MPLLTDRDAMVLALDAAARGPRSDPNPRVGCVVVSTSGHALATAWHRGAGTPHAEVAALAGLSATETRGATVVVTLEPCNHHGRTGPCSEALLAAGIGRVVYGSDDPGAASQGGAARLRAGGVRVERSELADDCDELIRVWRVGATSLRPFVTVKWASTLDGRAAATDGSSRWITGGSAREDVHRRRGLHDAIAVGTGTILRDDPSLTARVWGGKEAPDGAGHALAPDQPMPVVWGRRDIPGDARVRRHPRGVVTLPGDDLAQDLRHLTTLEVRSVFVEGGPTLASAFLRAGLADEVLAYVAPRFLGGGRPVTGDLGIATVADALRYRFTEVQLLGSDVLLVARPESGAVSATAEACDTDPSASISDTSQGAPCSPA